MFVLIMGAIGSKSRSPGQILVKSCLHSLGYIFGLATVTQVSDTGPSWPSCSVSLTKRLTSDDAQCLPAWTLLFYRTDLCKTHPKIYNLVYFSKVWGYRIKPCSKVNQARI